ncbi:MAG: hypothetical protein CVV27_09640, partial [Candidatus Melainabacteria bacterium HGW-Melainabacteria-1]
MPQAADIGSGPRWRRYTKWLLKGFGALLGVLAASTAIWAMLYPDAAAYLMQSAKGQWQLLSQGEPVADLLAQPDTPAELKRQLKLVAEVKAFAEGELGLKATRNYETYLDLKRDYLVMVLTGSPPLKMTSETWWFPIVGTVPYKGYFDKTMGLADQKKLSARGLETHFRPSPAYSTLGWFTDPLLSTMLMYGDDYLVNTVIHESVHATHWISGEVTFNENMASFIGNQGALRFYLQKFGKDSKNYRDALDKLADQERFAAFMNAVGKEMGKLYDSDLSEAEKLKRKPELIKT